MKTALSLHDSTLLITAFFCFFILMIIIGQLSEEDFKWSACNKGQKFVLKFELSMLFLLLCSFLALLCF